MFIEILHNRLSNTILLYVFFLALWGFFRFFRKQGVDSNYWGALVIAEVVILVQGVIGIILWASNLRPGGEAMHILYGVVGALGIPAVYAFTRGRDERREVLIYAAVLLFLSGVFLRSWATGIPAL
ncbi:MAG: hypothetical protein JW862_02820 [Anaerolineales bacterium]|nr:hypothetical protein [Anaerolineales bacterium]